MDKLQLAKAKFTPKQIGYFLIILIFAACMGYYLSLVLVDVPIMDNWVLLAASAEKVINGDLTLQDWFGGNASGHHSLDAIPATYFVVEILRFNTVAINIIGFALSLVCLFVLFRAYKDSMGEKHSVFELPVFLLISIQFFTLGKWEILTQPTSMGFFWRLLMFFGCFVYVSNILVKKTFTIKKTVISFLIILYTVNFGGAGYSAAFLASIVGVIIVDWIVEFKSWDKKRYLCLGGIAFGCILALFTYLGAGLLASNVQSSDGVQPTSLVGQLIDLLTGGNFVYAMLYGLTGSIVHVTTVEKLTALQILMIGSVIFVLTVVSIVLYFKKKIYQRTTLPLIFIIYGYVNIVLIAMSRSGFPFYGTIASRYIFDTLFIPLSIIWIFGLSIMDCKLRSVMGKCTFAVMMLPLVLLTMLTIQTNMTEAKIAPHRKTYYLGLQQMILNIDEYEDGALAPFQSAPHFVREGIRVMEKYKLSFMADEKNIEEIYQNFKSGISSDGWVEKEAMLHIKTGDTGGICLELDSRPEFGSGTVQIFVEEELVDEVVLDGLNPTAVVQLAGLPENTFVRVKLKADFSFTNPPDIRELSFIFKDYYGY